MVEIYQDDPAVILVVDNDHRLEYFLNYGALGFFMAKSSIRTTGNWILTEESEENLAL